MSTLILDPFEGGPGTGRKASLATHECADALPVCIWCDNTFPPDPQHPQSRICAGCAAKEQFPDKGAKR